jgi:hypothetical protein
MYGTTYSRSPHFGDFDDAWDYLRRGRNKSNRPYLHANGTRVVYLGQIEQGWECIALRYWNTDVVRWYRNVANKRNKWFSVNAQYNSNTTKKRIETSTGVNHLWMDKVTGYVCLGDLGEKWAGSSGVEKPVIADHETWLKRDKGVLKVRYKKRCEARRQNMVSAFTKRKSDQYYEAMNRLHDTALRRVKLLEDWMTKGGKKKALASNLKRKPGIPMELAKFGEKTVEQTLREIEMFKNRVTAARNAALSEERHYVDLPERYETTKRLVYLENEVQHAMAQLKTIETFNGMLREKKELGLEIRKLSSHKDALKSLESALKELRETSNKVWSLKTEVQAAERKIRLAETITNINQATVEKARLTSEVDALKEELAYLLKMKEGTTPEGLVDFLNRL